MQFFNWFICENYQFFDPKSNTRPIVHSELQTTYLFSSVGWFLGFITMVQKEIKENPSDLYLTTVHEKPGSNDSPRFLKGSKEPVPMYT